MKLKIYFFIIFSIGILQHSFCQETKTYSSDNGNFVYQYYENSQMERIYNGQYKENYKNCIIKGQFKENMKTGNWYYLNQEGSYKHREYFGNYINDKKNGVWTYKLDYNERTKKFNTVFNLNFRNDTIVGHIDFSNFDLTRNKYGGYKGLEFGYKGELDSIGNFTGIWQKKANSKNEDIIEFYKNFIIKILKRNLETGEIIEKYLPNKDLITKKIDEFYSKKIISLNNKKEYQNASDGIYRVYQTTDNDNLLSKYFVEIFHQQRLPIIASRNYEIIDNKIVYYRQAFFLTKGDSNSNGRYKFGEEEK